VAQPLKPQRAIAESNRRFGSHLYLRRCRALISISAAVGIQKGHTEKAGREMTRHRRLLITGAAILALGVAGVGIPQAMGGSVSNEQVAGPQAERAKRAALEVVGAGQVVGVRRAERGTGWVVEVFKPRERLGPWWGETTVGRQVEVRLNREFEWVRAGTDDGGSVQEGEYYD
jgi:hypothetical protein